MFKLNFGRLTGKAYTKGERVLRFEAIAHNTAELRCGRMIEKFPEIVTQLAGIAERFATALDCVDTGFIADGILDELPTGSTLGATRVGGVDPNEKRIRDALSAVLALAPAPHGFTVGEFAAKVRAMTGTSAAAYSIRQAAYDLRKLRGKQLVDKPARTRRHRVPALAARTIAPLLTPATRSSPRSSLRCAAPAWDANSRIGHASTVTTNESASTCKRCSPTSPSKPCRLRIRHQSATAHTNKLSKVDPQAASFASLDFSRKSA